MRKGLLLRRSGGRHPIHDGAAAGAIQFNSILGATILGAPPRPKGIPAASDALLRQHAEAADGGRRTGAYGSAVARALSTAVARALSTADTGADKHSNFDPNQ